MTHAALKTTATLAATFFLAACATTGELATHSSEAAKKEVFCIMDHPHPLSANRIGMVVQNNKGEIFPLYMATRSAEYIEQSGSSYSVEVTNGKEYGTMNLNMEKQTCQMQNRFSTAPEYKVKIVSP